MTHFRVLCLQESGTLKTTGNLYVSTGGSDWFLINRTNGEVTANGSGLTVAGSTTLNGAVAVTNTTTGYIEGSELASDPAAPASDRGRLYFRDNGSGKTQLVVRFPTGAVQIIATEP